MATNQIMCSIPLELGNFLEKNPEISPSKVLQQKLYEMMNEEFKLQERLKAYEIKLSKLTAKIQKMCDFIEAKGLTEEATNANVFN